MSSEGTRRVAIIGGGLAGLTCALALKKRGVDATVFEASPRAGGRGDAGIPYLLGKDLFKNTFQLIEELGLSSKVLPIEPYAGQVYRGHIYRHRVASATGLLRFKGLNLADKALLPRMAYLLARYSHQLDFHRPELGVGLDDETVASFIKRELSQNILNRIAGPLISTLFFYSSEETSRLLYLQLARHMYNTQMSTIRGGIGNVVDGMANQFRFVHRRVERITPDGDSYAVAGERFSSVVVAVRGDAVLGIDGVRDMLGDDDQQFFRDCAYQRVVNVSVSTERPVDGSCYAVSIPRIERMAANTISFVDFIDSSRIKNGGLLIISGGGTDVMAPQLLSDFEKLYRIVPAVTETSESTSAMPKFPSGRFRQIAAFHHRKRRTGLCFAGDYLFGPFLEGAITSGLKAAQTLTAG